MKPFAHIRRMLPLVALTTAAVTATITTSAQTASGLAPAVEQRIRMNTSSAVNANWTFRFGGPYYSHLFIDKIYAKSDPIIPCQSVFDVQIAARLGFKFIEANVHATATPGKYIVMHGVRGCLGDQVTDLDGNSAADVVIRQTPFDTLMSKYRYRSRYAKYRTHITSMEEFLLECRRNNIAPMISHVDEEQVRIIRSIMGENFILYWGTREEFSGPILEYHTYKSIRQIVDRCKYMGAPYLYCMGNVRDFTDEQLRTIAREVHNVGCYVGYAGCYEPPQNNQKLLDMGFDFSASGWDINEIDNGNLCNLTADLRFDDFRTDGTEREAVLCLDAGQSVAPGVELPSEFLSGGSLHVRFEGKIRVEMGDYIHTEFASDGELLIFHDAHIDGKRIDQTPYAEFKDYRLENGEPIPTLDQYLAQAKKYPKTVLVFEMKWHSTDEIENRAIALSIEKLKKYKLFSPKHVIFISFSPNASRVLAQSAPGFTVQYLGSDRRPAQAAEMGMNGVDTWFKTLLDDATWYPEARKLGMSINTWTVNDPAQMETLFKMGVDQLTTDNPMQAREVLEKIGMREVVAGKKVKIKK